jgi:EmrB/QacA subfamily drug resistance transporter
MTMTYLPARNTSALLWALMIGLLICGLDMSVVNIMLPKLQTVFDTSVSQIMMLATVYLTTMAALQLIFGRCSDVFDSALVFLVGTVVFLSGSIGCALSGSFHQMLLGRIVQGFGGAMLAASFGAIILRNFPREKIGSTMGVLLMVTSVGTIIGPPLGGFFAENLSWHWAFVINIPLCLMVIAGIMIYLRSNPRETTDGIASRLRLLDARGAVFSILMFGSLPTALGMAARKGWDSTMVWVLLGLFALSLCMFIIFESRAEIPLMQLEAFRNPGLITLVILKLLLFMVISGILLVFPFFLTRCAGLSSAEAGLALLSNAIAMAVATPFAGRLSDRFGEDLVMMLSVLGLLAVSVSSLSVPHISSPAGLAGLLVLFGIAGSGGLIPSTALILKQAPKGQEGVFSSINSLTMPVGGAIGLSFFSLVYTKGAAGQTGVAAAREGFIFAVAGLIACACLLVICAVAYKKAVSGSLIMDAKQQQGGEHGIS